MDLRISQALASAYLLFLAASGCVSSSIRSDVARVRELTRVSHLPRVQDDDVDPEMAGEARRMLQEPLDADAAVRIAVLNHRELRASLRELGVARGRLMQAGLPPNPVAELELLPERDSKLELRVEYNITGALLASRRLRAEAPALEAARYRAAAAVIDLGYRVRTAFYRLQAVEQRLAIAQRVLEALLAGRDAARAMFAAGNVPELNVASHEVASERARISVAQMELEVAVEREAVRRLLGVEDATATLRVADLLPAPEKPAIPIKVEGAALDASLELLETKERLESLSRRAGVSQAEGWLPDITADVHALLTDSEADGGEETWRFGAGVSVGIPIFDRGQGMTTELEAEFAALMERYYGMAVEIRSSVRDARTRVVSAHGRARQYQTIIVPAQERVTQQTLLQYNAMQLGVFELLQARREEFDIQLAYVETLREYWSAVAELDAALSGKRVTKSSSAPASMTGMASSAEEGH